MAWSGLVWPILLSILISAQNIPWMILYLLCLKDLLRTVHDAFHL